MRGATQCIAYQSGFDGHLTTPEQGKPVHNHFQTAVGGQSTGRSISLIKQFVPTRPPASLPNASRANSLLPSTPDLARSAVVAKRIDWTALQKKSIEALASPKHASTCLPFPPESFRVSSSVKSIFMPSPMSEVRSVHFNFFVASMTAICGPPRRGVATGACSVQCCGVSPVSQVGQRPSLSSG